MIRDMAQMLMILVFLECLYYATSRPKWAGWKGFDWLGTAQHLLAAWLIGWLVFKPYSVNTGHVLALLVIVAGFIKAWIYRIGFDRRVGG